MASHKTGDTGGGKQKDAGGDGKARSMHASKNGDVAPVWPCETCGVVNPSVIMRCLSCDAWNPAAPRNVDRVANLHGVAAVVPASPPTATAGAKTSAAGAASATASAATAGASPAPKIVPHANTKTAEPAAAVAAAPTPLSAFTVNTSQWECPVCEVANPPERKDCRSCTTPRATGGSATAPPPAAVAGSGFAAGLAVSGNWECPVCEVQNPSSALACRSCTTLNPNAVAPATATASSGAGASNSAAATATATTAPPASGKPAVDITAMFGLNNQAGSQEVPGFDATAAFTFGADTPGSGFTFGSDALAPAPTATSAPAVAPSAIGAPPLLPAVGLKDSMSPQSRVGRELQRWDGNFRLVGATVPFRLTASSTAAASSGSKTAEPSASASSYEFLLTNSSDGKEWIFPKGGWETDESATDGAARECYEEAGVKGHAVFALPTIEYGSKKQTHCTRLFPFLFRVTTVLDDWPEKHRKRQWVPFDQVKATLSREEMMQIWSYASAAVRDGKHLLPALPTSYVPPSGAGPNAGVVLASNSTAATAAPTATATATAPATATGK